MAMYDSANKLREEFKELFKDGMTPRQVRWAGATEVVADVE